MNNPGFVPRSRAADPSPQPLYCALCLGGPAFASLVPAADFPSSPLCLPTCKALLTLLLRLSGACLVWHRLLCLPSPQLSCLSFIWPSQGLTALGPRGVLRHVACLTASFQLLCGPIFSSWPCLCGLVQSSQCPWSGPLPPVQVPGLLQAGEASRAGLGTIMRPQCWAVGALG